LEYRKQLILSFGLITKNICHIPAESYMAYLFKIKVSDKIVSFTHFTPCVLEQHCFCYASKGIFIFLKLIIPAEVIVQFGFSFHAMLRVLPNGTGQAVVLPWSEGNLHGS